MGADQYRATKEAVPGTDHGSELKKYRLFRAVQAPSLYSKVSAHSPVKSPYYFLIYSHSLPWEMKAGSTGDFSSYFHLLLQTHAAS